MGTYVEIPLEEMEKFLKRAFRAFRPKQGIFKGNEYYYILTLGPNVGIRIMTSVKTRSGVGAGRGVKTMKVQLVSLRDGGLLMRKEKQPTPVKRTTNWKDSIKDRVGELVEKYDDGEEFWEKLALTRSRPADPEREMERQEREEEREQQESERRQEELKDTGIKGFPTPEMLRRFPKQKRMTGDVTPPQLRYVNGLLSKIKHDDWHELNLYDVTGIDHILTRDERQALTKQQASMIIEILLEAGFGRKYASEEEDAEFERYASESEDYA